MGLLDSLGLDQVEADPNSLPDGKYGSVLYKADIIATKTDKVMAMFVFKVNDGGKQHGKEKPEFWEFGTGVVKAEDGTISFTTPTMTEDRKSWFKNRLIALGVPDAQTPKFDQAMADGLVGTEVFMGIKNKNGYCNINFIERRNAGAGNVASTTAGVDPFAGSTPASTPTGSIGVNISDL
jgi:hypothetical protein